MATQGTISMKRLEQAYTGLRCTECSRFFEDNALGLCPKCGGLLDTVMNEAALTQHSRDHLGNSEKSMWRFRMFLPIFIESQPVTAGEGGTPLRPIKSYSSQVWVKDETRNPTGSFKDRGASVAVSHLYHLNIRKLVLASEGNAGCAFALYSQMAGVQCRVYLPKQANPTKVTLSKKLGAKVTQVSGTTADAGRHAARVAEEKGEYNASTFVTPFRHDGKGTMALEISEQLGWDAPDFVVYPVGGGVGLIGMWKMFKILHKLGWTHNRPRMIAVQPRGCAPVVEAHNHGKVDVEEWKSPRTIAQGLKIPKPLAGKWILKCLRESKAIALKVTDGEILKGVRQVARSSGMIVEPSSAAAFAAIPKVNEMGVVDKSDRVVVIATGSGLKTPEQL